MNVAVAPDPVLPGPLSPELVLVSPPEVARLARKLLSPPPAARRAAPITPEAQLGAATLTAVWLFCLATTLCPLIFTALVTR